MGSSLNNLTFLVVDDETEITTFLVNIFEGSGSISNVVTANDGVEAWNKISKQDFSLIICDLMMPKKGGLELIKQIKADPRKAKIPIVVISAFFEAEHIEFLKSYNIKALLTKPFTSDQLKQKVRELLVTT